MPNLESTTWRGGTAKTGWEGRYRWIRLPRDKWEKKKMTMDRSRRMVTFKGQDPGKRTRKKKKKNGQEEEGNRWQMSPPKLNNRTFLKMKAIGKTKCHKEVKT